MAWMKTLCKTSYRLIGKHTSVIELGAMMARAASHELGHA